MAVGKSIPRLDARDKVTGRTKYTDDLCDKGALVARILHSTIPHGRVKSVDTSEACAIPGVVAVFTCFDAPKYHFPTAGHPWSTDPGHQDVADRLLLTENSAMKLVIGHTSADLSIFAMNVYISAAKL